MKVNDIVYCKDLKSFAYVKGVGMGNNIVICVSRACEPYTNYYYGYPERDINLILTLDEFESCFDEIKVDLLNSDKCFDWEID